MNVHQTAMRIEAQLRGKLDAPIEQVDVELHDDGASGLVYAYADGGLLAFAGFDVAELYGADPARLAELVEAALTGHTAERVH